MIFGGGIGNKEKDTTPFNRRLLLSIVNHEEYDEVRRINIE